MTKDKKKAKIVTETPKRNRSEDEISPSVKPDSKLRKTMEVDQAEFHELKAVVMSMSKQLDKLNMLDTMNAEIKEIRLNQDNFRESLHLVDTRVDVLEREVETLRESHANACGTIRFLEKKNHIVEQERLNDIVMLNNLPREICNDQAMLKNVIDKILTALDIDPRTTHCNSKAFPSTKTSTAVVELKLSPSLKSKAMEKFKAIKSDKANDGKLLIEKFVQLPVESQLNGRMLTMSNKLTPHYLNLKKHAQTFVKSHLEFVYETPDSRILVFAGRFHRIDDDDDLRAIIKQIDEGKISKKKINTKPALGSSSNHNPMKTRNKAKFGQNNQDD